MGVLFHSTLTLDPNSVNGNEQLRELLILFMNERVGGGVNTFIYLVM